MYVVEGVALVFYKKKDKKTKNVLFHKMYLFS